jgi:hypothetical protein
MNLKEGLTKDEDYQLVSNSVWKKLMLKFGGAPEIGLNIVDRGNTNIAEASANQENVDTAPVTVGVWYYGDFNEPLV